MRKYIVFLFSLVLLCNCTKKTTVVSKVLDNAEECIEQFPDSSLNILNTLEISRISNLAEKARYALLKSMALDKNYIDVTSDSLTSIALAYYVKCGTPDEILKAYYYNGKINAYAGNYEEAMNNYIKAEKYVDNSCDNLAIGRLYNAKMNIYKSIYDLDKAITPAELSSYFYLQAKDTIRYITALNSLSSILLAANNFDSLEKNFNRIKIFEDKMSLSQKNVYFVNKINYGIAIKDSMLTKNLFEYRSAFKGNEKMINWVVLARAYNELGENIEAVKALEEYDRYNKIYEDIYYYYASEVYNSIEDYEKAYKYLKHYQNNLSKENLKLFKSDTKFLEEKYHFENERLKQKYVIIVLGLVVIIIVILVILVSFFIKNILNHRNLKLKELKEQELKLKNEYEKAIIEKNKLRYLLSSSKLTKDTRAVIEERMEILNSFIVSGISGVNMEKSLLQLKNYLNDSEKFIYSTKMSFEVTHPKFIAYLLKSGLSEWEIGCCCLYCVGLNGSEISTFLNIKYFYKRSSIIRKKLNVQSINIDTFLLNKLQELS